MPIPTLVDAHKLDGVLEAHVLSYTCRVDLIGIHTSKVSSEPKNSATTRGYYAANAAIIRSWRSVIRCAMIRYMALSYCRRLARRGAFIRRARSQGPCRRLDRVEPRNTPPRRSTDCLNGLTTGRPLTITRTGLTPASGDALTNHPSIINHQLSN